jgi:hypothetical protein
MLRAVPHPLPTHRQNNVLSVQKGLVYFMRMRAEAQKLVALLRARLYNNLLNKCISGYNAFRELCGLKRVDSFDYLADLIPGMLS